MKNTEWIKKNQITEIVVETLLKNEVEQTNQNFNVHYVFDDFGRLVMEFKGESFKGGKLLSDEYALNINYASSSNLPSSIDCYRVEEDQLIKYKGVYHYDNGNLIKYTSTQGNTIKTLTYEEGRVALMDVHSDIDSLKGKYKYEYPNESTIEIHKLGHTAKARDHYEVVIIQEYNEKKQLVKESSNPSIGLEKVHHFSYKDNRLLAVKNVIPSNAVYAESFYVYDQQNFPVSIKEINYVFYTEVIESIVEMTFKYYKH